MPFVAHVAFSAVTAYQVPGQLWKTQGISQVPEHYCSKVQWFCLGAWAPGMRFALGEYDLLRDIDYRALCLDIGLLAHRECWLA